MEKEIDCWGTDTVICPYCGHDNGGEDGDGPPQGRQTCSNEECEKDFSCEPNYTVDYSTAKVPCWNGGPHTWTKPYFFTAEDTKGYIGCKGCGKSETVER